MRLPTERLDKWTREIHSIFNAARVDGFQFNQGMLDSWDLMQAPETLQVYPSGQQCSKSGQQDAYIYIYIKD